MAENNASLAHNSSTPMSHLFLETDLNFEGEENEEYYYGVRRTGTAATLLNLSYFESETVLRVFNEILLLLVNPVLDQLFRNSDTGTLKEHFVFIVDNGPFSERVSDERMKTMYTTNQYRMNYGKKLLQTGT